MRAKFLSALLGFAIGLGAMGVGSADAAFSSATYRGKAFCPKGTHYSPRKGGQCWSCKGRRRNGIAPIAGSKACKIKAYNKFRRANLKKPRGKILKLKCGKGYRLNAPAGLCSSCPGGYRRSIHSVKKGKACYQRVRAKHYRATYVQKFGCGRGQVFSLRKGGQCWSCPRGYVRTISKVTGKRACTNKFGEIFAANKGAMCRKVVSAIRDGSNGVDKFKNEFRKLTAPVTEPIRKAMNKAVPDIKSPKALQKVTRQINATTKRFQPVLGELARVANLVNRRPNLLANVMLNADVMCSRNPRKIQTALVRAGLNPNFKVKNRRKAGLLDGLLIRSAHAKTKTSRRVFHAVSVGADFVTKKLFGPTLSFTVVTDFHQNLHLYFSFGAVLATASGYDRSVGYMIFPHASISDFDKFDQLGLELGFSSIKKYENFVAKKKFLCQGPARTTPVPGPGGPVVVPVPKQLHCRWPKDVGIAVSFDPPVFKNFIANVPGIGLSWSGTIKKHMEPVKLFGGMDVSLSGDFSWKLLGN